MRSRNLLEPTETAARPLGIGYSLTLHGSDLLLNASYLDMKLADCRFCVTVSDYNRRYILAHYPAVSQGKVMVSRLGIEIPEREPAEGYVSKQYCVLKNP